MRPWSTALVLGLWAAACAPPAPAGSDDSHVADVDASRATADSADSAADATLDPGALDLAGDQPASPGEVADGSSAPDTATAGADTPPGDCAPGAPCDLLWKGPCDQGVCDDDGACRGVKIPGCCESDPDCAGKVATGPCDVPRCQSYACVAAARPGCCAESASCDDGLDCTVDSCSLPAGRCLHCADGCLCLEAPVALAQGFDAELLGATGFSAYSLNSVTTVAWRTDDARWVRPPRAAYLGRVGCHTYYGGQLDAGCQPVDSLAADSQPVHVVLRSPQVALGADGPGHVALFWLWADVQPAVGGPSAGEPDVLRVRVEDWTDPLTWEVASSLDVGKDTDGEWRLLAVDLAPWRGRDVVLAFDFDTLDGKSNHHEGIYLDELAVVSRCAGGCCAEDADCAGQVETDPCTMARCVALTDGAGAVCAGVPVAPGEPCVACSADADCPDDDPCTADTCGPEGRCVHTVFCCFESDAWVEGFEGGLGAWFVEDPAPGDGVAWQTSELSAVGGASSAWFGDPASGSYRAAGEAAAPTSGALRSEVLTLPQPGAGQGQVMVELWLRLETEWDGVIYDNPAGVDRLTLAVASDGVETEVWSSDMIGGTTDGLWIEVAASLQSWAGEAVQLVLAFDSVDATSNDHAGPFVDDLRVGVRCGDP